MNFTNTIQRWFRDEGGGSLLLPDGWYGRPHDSRHAITSVIESGESMTIVLDRKLTLRFDGLKSVRAQPRELTLGPFDKLRFDWESFDPNGDRGTKDFLRGEVKILAGP